MSAALCTQALFQKLEPGRPVSVLGLEIVPLLLRETGAPEPNALLLEEAISAGHTVVNEVNEGGVVGQVRVLHRGGLPLLVLQGEQILGAKQNRSFNSSFVVAPGKEVVLPVSCVEQGRWHRKSAAFEAGATTLSPELRARKLKRVSESITMHGTYDANQHGVWSDVREYMQATGSHSVTASYEDARQTKAPQVERELAGLEPLPEQSGLAVVRDGRLVMLDAFGSPRLFARAFKKCLRGALSEASSPSEKASATEGATATDVVRQALELMARVEPVHTRSPSDGDTWTGRAGSVAYTAAVYEGAVYHCAAAG